MEVNEEKRKKFMENAGKRVNKVMHDISILEPMARSNTYDFTKEDVEKMFFAMQDALDATKAEYCKKFEEKSRSERKLFSFDNDTISNVEANSAVTVEVAPTIENINENNIPIEENI